jgi:hypothetical protein
VISWFQSFAFSNATRTATPRTQLAALRGHTRWVERLAVGADGATLVSAAADNTVRIWDIRGALSAAGVGTSTLGSTSAGAGPAAKGGEKNENGKNYAAWSGADAAVGTLRLHASTVWDACFHGVDSLVTCSIDGTVAGLTLAPPGRRGGSAGTGTGCYERLGR